MVRQISFHGSGSHRRVTNLTTHFTVNLTPIGRKDMSAPEALKGLEPRELAALQLTGKFMTLGRAYAEEHATRPATIGFVLSSSPVALLAW